MTGSAAVDRHRPYGVGALGGGGHHLARGAERDAGDQAGVRALYLRGARVRARPDLGHAGVVQAAPFGQRELSEGLSPTVSVAIGQVMGPCVVNGIIHRAIG